MAEDIEQRVQSFVDRKKNAIDNRLKDLKVSRSFASGFGFTEKDRELRGEEGRAEITANVVKPWFNSVISSYTANPFVVSARRYDGGNAQDVNGIMGYMSTKAKLDDVAMNVLADMVNDGYGYMLVDVDYDNPVTKTQYAKPVLLDNSRVFLDDCETATGADCQMGVYIDLIRKDTAEERYGVSQRLMNATSDPFASIAYYGKSKASYTSLATVYELSPDGVTVTTLIHGRQVGEPRLVPGLTRLPIVRFAAEKVWFESIEEFDYRGAYWFVFDLVRSVNFNMSLQAETIATKPTIKFMSPKGAFDGMSAQLADINKKPKLYVEYNSFDEMGRPIPAPTPFADNVMVDGLMDVVEKTNAMITAILGNPTAEAPSNETAEAVLLRKGIQEATVSRFLKALRDGLEEVGRVMLEMIPAMFAAERMADGKLLPAIQAVNEYYCVADSGPLAQSQKQRSIAVLMAIGNMIKENPANPVLPFIVANSELSDEEKRGLISRLQPQQQQLPPEVQQAMAAKDQQITQMGAAMADAQKQIAGLQQALFEMQNDSRAKILVAQIDAQTKLQLKQMELANSDAQLQAQIVADANAQTQKLQAELTKEIAKARANAPMEPVFDRGRFV